MGLTDETIVKMLQTLCPRAFYIKDKSCKDKSCKLTWSIKGNTAVASFDPEVREHFTNDNFIILANSLKVLLQIPKEHMSKVGASVTQDKIYLNIKIDIDLLLFDSYLYDIINDYLGGPERTEEIANLAKASEEDRQRCLQQVLEENKQKGKPTKETIQTVVCALLNITPPLNNFVDEFKATAKTESKKTTKPWYSIFCCCSDDEDNEEEKTHYLELH